MSSTRRLDRVMSRSHRSVLFATAALVFLARAGAAQPSRAPDLGSNPDSTLTIAIQQIVGAPIGLEDAQRMALVQATDVRAAEARMHAAHGALRHESGAFDPELFL